MHEYNLLLILAMGFTLALFFGYLTKRIGFSPIVGYMIAGFFIGPATPGFTGDMDIASQLSEIGVILMMFSVGMHFDIKDLLAVRRVALPGALMQITASAVFSVLIAHVFGMPYHEGVILGLGLAVASTVVLLRVLEDNNKLDTPQGHVAVGWLVVEDIFTVVVLVLLPSLAVIMSGEKALSISLISGAIGIAFLKLALLWVVVLMLGGKFIPWVLEKVARTRSEELFTLTVLVSAFATAVGAAYVFNASMALGGFLGGMVVGRSTLHHQAGANLVPLKDAFSVLFFVAVGMLFKPSFIVNNYQLVLACLAIVLLIKPLVAFFAVMILGYSVTMALTVGTALAQVGEFSFILAQQGQHYNIISEDVFNVLVVCAFVSIMFNPGFFGLVPKIENLLRKNEKLWSIITARYRKKGEIENNEQLQYLHTEGVKHRLAVVIGYGPTGRSVTKNITESGITPIIIEMNVDTVREVNAQGLHAVYGNSSDRRILKAAQIEKAEYIIVTLSNMDAAVATVTAARTLNHTATILARGRFIKDGEMLLYVGANAVAVEEKEVAETLAALFNNKLLKKQAQ